MTRTPRPPLRLVAALGLFLVLLATLVAPPTDGTVAQTSIEADKTCTGPEGGGTATIGEIVTCTLTISGTVPISAGTIVITAVGGNYVFTDASCDASGTDDADCVVDSVGASTITIRCLGTGTATCTSITVGEDLEVTSLASSQVTQRVLVLGMTLTATAANFRVVAPGTTVFVSTTGDDANNCRTRRRACKTLNRALQAADDGDSVLIFGGTYDIERTVFVDKLVTIEPDGMGVKVILTARPAVTIFAVRFPCYRNRHDTILNTTTRRNYKEGG